MIQNAITIFLIGLVAIISPGPDFFLVLRNSFKGQRAALKTVSGIVVGCFLQIVACVLGLSVLLQQNPLLFKVVKWLGAGYLVYLGLKSLHGFFSTKKTSPTITLEPARDSMSFFREGLFCNFLNPKFSLFLISLFAQFTTPFTPVSERVLYGATLWVQAVLYWYTLALALQTSRVQPIVTRFGKFADPALGVILAGLGLRILVAG